MLQKKVIVCQFSQSNLAILAGADIGLANDVAATQNEQKAEDKKLLKLVRISDHIHFRRGRKERKMAKQWLTIKKSTFAYISNMEEMSGSGWEAFKDCGTVAFHNENGPPPMKKSKDTMKVARTYRLKRILRVDQQPGNTDNKDEEDSSDMDGDPDFMILSDEEVENKGQDREVDDKVAIAVSRLMATVTIRNFNPPSQRSARLAEPKRGGR